MAKFPREIISRLSKLNLAEIVSEHCEMSGNGKELKSSCPFPDHSDSSPSFMVNPDKNVFFCHGCQKGGGVIQFVMNMWNFDFEQAVRYLCEKYKIPLEEGEIEDVYYEIMESLCQIYEDILAQEKPQRALDYLKLERGLSDETIKEFRIGCTLDYGGFSPVFQAMSEIYEKEDLIKMGVGFYSEYQEDYVDYFRGRIVWPIQNINGKVIGMAGRDFTGTNPVKYINSPETPIFSKKRILFNLHRGQPEATKEKEVIIFEDYFSIFMSWQHGVKNTLSTMGTAFGDYTSKICSRVTNNGIIYLCLDPDKAGDEASIAMATSLMNNNSQTKIIRLPKDEDPDEVIRFRGVKDFLKFKSEALSPLEFLASYFNSYDLSTIEGHLKAVEELTKIVKLIDNGVTRNIISDKLKKQVGIESEVPIREVAKNFKAETVNEIPNIELEFLACLIQYPEARKYLEDIDPYCLTEIGKMVFDLVKESGDVDGLSIHLSGFIEYLKNIKIKDLVNTFAETAAWINMSSGQKYLAETLIMLKTAQGDDKQKLTNEYLELLGGRNESST